MDKDLIIKYINKSASKEERQRVLEWASQSKEHETLLTEMMNTWVAEHMPQEEASDAKYNEFIMYRRGYNSSTLQFKKRARINIFALTAAAAVIIFMFCWNLILMQQYKGDDKATLAITETQHGHTESIQAIAHNTRKPATDMRSLYTNKGVKAQIMLPDSSVVWLNSDTRIEYPETFNDNVREVKLSGEAYFEVRTDSLCPMIITTEKGFKVKVTGTSFNIKAYENDDVASTTLYTGSISLLYNGTNNKLVEKKIRPNQSVNLSAKKIDIKTAATVEQIKNASIWKAGRIHFDATPISEVIKILNRWHGSQFSVTDPEILNYKITADFENESIIQIMDLIKMTTYIDYSISGKHIKLSKR